MAKIVFLDASTVTFEEDVDLSSLMALGDWSAYPVTAPHETASRVGPAEIVISNKVLINGDLIHSSPKLQLIAVAATGTNNVDLQAAKAAGVQVCNVTGYSTESVAQHTIATLLILATNIHRYGAEPMAWTRSPIFTRLDYPVVTLHRRQLGLIGVGRIGGRVGEIAQALGMKVQCYDRPGSAHAVHPEWPRCSLGDLLATSDAVSLHCPLTETTRGLIDEAALARMPPGSFLVNTGRGELIDEGALLSSLRSGHLGGAGLDVLSVEPPPADHPLITANLPNLLITPHTAWSSGSTRQELVCRVAQNIDAFLQTGIAGNRLV